MTELTASHHGSLHRGLKPFAWVRIVAIGTAMFLAALATRKGPGLSVDSVNYLSAGINIANGDDWVAVSGQALTIFPPGLPLLAALGEVGGIGAQMMLRIVSIVSFGLIVGLGSRLLQRVVPHRGVELGATAMLAVSPVLLGVATMAWSEPPFIVVTLIFLFVLGDIWERGALTATDVLRLAGLCWMAFILRYAGTALIAAAGVSMLAAIRPLDRRVLTRIAAFGVVSMSFPILWILRNYGADGTYMGRRSPSPDSIRVVAARTGAVFGDWAVPMFDPSTRVLTVIGIVGVGLIMVGVGWVLRSDCDETTGGVQRGQLLACTTFAIVYVSYLTLASVATSFEPTNSRYLSPVYVPGLALASAGLAALLNRHAGRRWSVAVGCAAVLFWAGPVITTIGNVRDGFTNGIGYNADASTQSELSVVAAEILSREAPVNVFSNEVSRLWAGARLQPIKWAPRDSGYRGAPAVGELDAFVDDVLCSPQATYLVYYLFGNDRVVPLREIRAVVDLERVAVVDDGVIFRVRSKGTQECAV
ncbi:MAG: hypothetical protein EXQ71_07385 [Acidimicrobiia bacterium]|nr:hypothetical protein [Acidimicrobiia bacterium]